MRLPDDAPLFNVPAGLIRIFDKDLAHAGIAKKDAHGRTLDVHALRHTFATHLSKNGVAPRTAMAAMRHSTINLTMITYTDPVLLDVRGAVDSLPALPLNGMNAREESQCAIAGSPISTIPRNMPRTAGPERKSLAFPGGAKKTRYEFRRIREAP